MLFKGDDLHDLMTQGGMQIDAAHERNTKVTELRHRASKNRERPELQLFFSKDRQRTVRAFSILGAAALRSASSNTIMGVLPPSSVWKILSVGAPAAEMILAVLVLPVKLITRTSFDSTSSDEPPEPLSLKTLTPRGKSAASANTWLNMQLV